MTFTVSTFTGVPPPSPTTILRPVDWKQKVFAHIVIICLLHSDKGTDVDHELVVDLPNVLRETEGDGTSAVSGREGGRGAST